jgi:H2-forming N5,N10-methylenetetrahydromethanopterin dehydrogenase-like enzyme
MSRAARRAERSDHMELLEAEPQILREVPNYVAHGDISLAMQHVREAEQIENSLPTLAYSSETSGVRGPVTMLPASVYKAEHVALTHRSKADQHFEKALEHPNLHQSVHEAYERNRAAMMEHYQHHIVPPDSAAATAMTTRPFMF